MEVIHMNTLEEHLQKFNHIIMNAYHIDINSGLCGVFALNAYTHLKSLGYKPKLLAIFRKIPSYKFGTKYNIPIHYVLNVEGKIIDSDGIVNSIADFRARHRYRVMNYDIIRVPFKELKRQLKEGGLTNHWNSAFSQSNKILVNDIFNRIFK